MTTVHAVTATQKTVDGPSNKVLEILRVLSSKAEHGFDDFFRRGGTGVALHRISSLHLPVQPKLSARSFQSSTAS